MANPTPEWTTNLPDSLKDPDNLAILKIAVKQWSQLVAWSWSSLLAFAGESQESQERTLKSFFIKTLQMQGQAASAYTSYGQQESKRKAEHLGEDIKNLLLGRNNEIEYLQNEGVTVTLSMVLEKLTGQKCITTENPEMTEKFTFQVVLDSYTGEILETAKNQYLAYMAYPARPALSEITLSEQQLYDWASNLNTQGDYLPPSPYIPIAGCSC